MITLSAAHEGVALCCISIVIFVRANRFFLSLSFDGSIFQQGQTGNYSYLGADSPTHMAVLHRQGKFCQEKRIDDGVSAIGNQVPC
jgi:hypothetical protein